MDVYFRELEPYYLGGVLRPFLQGESSSEENMLQEGGRGNEFIELENVNERVVKNVQQSCDGIPEIESEVLDIPKILESPISSELPMSTPLTEELTQNVLP